MKKAVIQDILKKKNNYTVYEKYKRFYVEDFSDKRIPEVTVHGRFQSSLHINHFYTYVATGFRIAKKVHFLITNPDLNEWDSSEGVLDRVMPDNNPFTYEERIYMIKKLLKEVGVPNDRYDFTPFKITETSEWEKILNKNIPNLVNTYGDWSKAKLAKFKEMNYKVIHSKYPKMFDVSGTKVREVLKIKYSTSEKKKRLINIGHMEEAIPSLLSVASRKVF